MLLLPDADCEIDPWGATDRVVRPSAEDGDVLEVLLAVLSD